MRSDIIKKYNLKNGGYGWIDHVSIENVYEIILEDEQDDIYETAQNIEERLSQIFGL